MNTPFPAARTGGGLVFTSGLAAIDPATMTVSAGTFDESAAPARTTTITTLPIDGLLIEIQAIAIAPSRENRS